MIFTIQNIKAQNGDSDPIPQEKVFFYLDVDELPRFNDTNVLEYIYKNIKYPDQIDIQGTVIVSFVVTKNGTVDNIKLEKNLYLNAMNK